MLAFVRKRDGETLQPFDLKKIERAIGAAWAARRANGGPLDQTSEATIHRLAQWVVTHASLAGEHVADVETIQDVVEIALMKSGHLDVAKHYVLYRERRAEARKSRRAADPKAIADYIHPSKYARFRPDLGRRELYSETVDRDEAMHLRRWADQAEVTALIRDAFDAVRRKEVLPSMRSMQFAGPAIEVNNARLFNCAFTHVDRPRVFSETLWLLLSGCGTGYSVQFRHVEKLPELAKIDEREVHYHRIDDSIEGWAEALDVLVASYTPRPGSESDRPEVLGKYVEFDFTGIRKRGTPLKISGGRAPGHMRLKRTLERIRAILDGAQGRKLRPIECHDIQCRSADAVLSGGIRRSAMLSLFSLDDGEMMWAKTGRWHETHPWRKNANNSVACLRGSISREQFGRVFRATKQWGEPAFAFLEDLDYGYNPCVEVGLDPILRTFGSDSYSGWAFCNLTNVNAAKADTPEALIAAAERAAVVGTVQAAYTSFPYLGWVSEAIAKRDALLGVGMVGIMDNPTIALDPEVQRRAAAAAVAMNERVAALIGINPAARVTTIKPDGTSSLELGGIGSGIHPHHARRYIRRVIANEDEVVFKHFRSVNPHMCVQKPDGDWVVEFPIRPPDGALLVDDFGAVEFLEKVESAYQNWVAPGTTARGEGISPGLTHNVSNTVVVRDHEWEAVEDFLWAKQDRFAAVSFIAHDGDKKYPFAPREAIVTEADEARWNQLVGNYVEVDYTKLVEAEDETSPTSVAACEGDKCEMPARAS